MRRNRCGFIALFVALSVALTTGGCNVPKPVRTPLFISAALDDSGSLEGITVKGKKLTMNGSQYAGYCAMDLAYLMRSQDYCEMYVFQHKAEPLAHGGIAELKSFCQATKTAVVEGNRPKLTFTYLTDQLEKFLVDIERAESEGKKWAGVILTDGDIYDVPQAQAVARRIAEHKNTVMGISMGPILVKGGFNQRMQDITVPLKEAGIPVKIWNASAGGDLGGFLKECRERGAAGSNVQIRPKGGEITKNNTDTSEE